MYEGGRGAGAAVTGAVVLPHTGGNAILTIVALTGIAAGVAILVSTLARAVAAKTYKV